MGKKHGTIPTFKGVKKSGVKAAEGQQAPAKTPQKVAKDAAGFLQQRLGKRVRELRLLSGGAPAGAPAADAASLADLRAEASRRGGNFERDGAAAAAAGEGEGTAGASCNRGSEAENTRRRFYAELRKVLAAADIIIEVLDARDPASCRCIDVEREVSSSGKRLILLLNKIDLVPKHAVEAWMGHLRRSFPVIAFKAALGNAQRPTHAMTSVSRASEGLLRSTHAVIGADELMQLLKNYARMGGGKSKAHLSVGVIGYPNTGKSSVINSMKRHAAVEVGGRAGVTKVMQEVQLDAKVTLIDSPGVVFEGASEDPAVVLRNVVRVEHILDPVSVVEALLAKAPREALLKFYNLDSDFERPSDFLIHIAQTRGKLRRGSGLDMPSAARSVISDWTTGKFRYFVLPPAEDSVATARAAEETAEVVGALAPRLDIDALLAGHGDLPAVLGAPQAERGGGDVDMGGCDEQTVEVDMP